eukprot:GHVP01068905.1.p1 GENE.GHVP01068905.1~~GHVP01068905.1.p1  ORF type:complete len:131 (+),score=24.99 GHVP01068905.1:43-435(+)
MKDATLRIRKFKSNPLLKRKQFAIEIIHPTRGTVTNLEIRESLAQKYSCPKDCVIVQSHKTVFGGGRSKAFGMIYENVAALKTFAPRYMQVRLKMTDVKPKAISRRLKKEIRHKKKKQRGTGKKVKKTEE